MRSALFAWFAENARVLPWREPEARSEPYRVLVAEVMLQQTQVATVIPYYQRWLERFPDLRALAESKEDAVLHAWQGLGYYRRALNLRRAARSAVERFGGELPAGRRALEELAGVGRYTAAAVAALAFDRTGVAVDANVRRLAARLHGWEHPPADPQVERALLARFGVIAGGMPCGQGDVTAYRDASADETSADADAATPTPTDGQLHAGQAATLAEALIELGALVCTPSSPHCDRCPLAAGCVAAGEGSPERYPRRRSRRSRPLRRSYALVAFQADRVWLARRRPGGLLGGLWGFPQVTAAPRGGRRLGPVRHAYSHFRLELTPVVVPSGHPALAGDPATRPHTLTSLEDVALSVVDRRVLARLAEEGLVPALAPAAQPEP